MRKPAEINDAQASLLGLLFLTSTSPYLMQKEWKECEDAESLTPLTVHPLVLIYIMGD